MHGNVMEWCEDIYVKDGIVTLILRGGSWFSDAKCCRSAYRGSFAPDFDGFVGFRLLACVHPGEETVVVQGDGPPPWASGWGRDETGAWADFTIEGKDGQQAVTQRMRWIPPGTFMMGSPETEAGRFDDETSPHEVTVVNGFWMADTACTQALWEAVMENNPSHFKGGDLPVESVSWHNAKAFIGKLNRRIPGLELSLPSEAQWEYACRAGTTSAFSFGDNLTTEQANQRGGYIPNPGQTNSPDEDTDETGPSMTAMG